MVVYVVFSTARYISASPTYTTSTSPTYSWLHQMTHQLHAALQYCWAPTSCWTLYTEGLHCLISFICVLVSPSYGRAHVVLVRTYPRRIHAVFTSSRKLVPLDQLHLRSGKSIVWTYLFSTSVDVPRRIHAALASFSYVRPALYITFQLHTDETYWINKKVETRMCLNSRRYSEKEVCTLFMYLQTRIFLTVVHASAHFRMFPIRIFVCSLTGNYLTPGFLHSGSLYKLCYLPNLCFTFPT